MAEVTMTVRAGAKVRQAWQRDMTPWTCVLKYEGRQMTVPFFMGAGHEGREPEVREVLDSLLSDASMVDCMSGTEWAAECGFSSEDAWEPIYESVSRQTTRLKRLLGDAYEAHVEVT
jgi:hypothetical protein